MVDLTAGGDNTDLIAIIGQNIHYGMMPLTNGFNIFNIFFAGYQRNDTSTGHMGILSHRPMGMQGGENNIFNGIDGLKSRNIYF